MSSEDQVIVEGVVAHEAANVFPMMDKKRLSELRDDIAKHGLLQPIVMFDDQILDGRNRYQACVDAGAQPRFVTVRDVDDPFAYVWSLNGARRDLTDAQRYLIWKACEEKSSAMQAEKRRIAAEAREKRAKAASERRREDGTLGPRSTSGGPSGPTTGSREHAPKVHQEREAKASAANVAPSTVRRMDSLAAKRPDLAEKVRDGALPAARAIRTMKADAAKEEARAAIENLREQHTAGSDLHRVIAGDFRTAGLEPESVDVILTDPPYPRDFVALYSDLSKTAARVLKPGGSLVAMVGQSYLPEVMSRLGEHLT